MISQKLFRGNFSFDAVLVTEAAELHEVLSAVADWLKEYPVSTYSIHVEDRGGRFVAVLGINKEALLQLDNVEDVGDLIPWNRQSLALIESIKPPKVDKPKITKNVDLTELEQEIAPSYEEDLLKYLPENMRPTEEINGVEEVKKPKTVKESQPRRRRQRSDKGTKRNSKK